MTVGDLMANLARTNPEAKVWIHEADPHFGTPKMHACECVVLLDDGDVVLTWQADLARQDAARMSERSKGNGC